MVVSFVCSDFFCVWKFRVLHGVYRKHASVRCGTCEVPPRCHRRCNRRVLLHIVRVVVFFGSIADGVRVRCREVGGDDYRQR